MKKAIIIILSSILFYGCWLNERKTPIQREQLPPTPEYKNKLIVQVADFKNETGLRHLSYLERTVVPYLRDNISQMKRIRLKEEYAFISNITTIKNFFTSKQIERDKHRDIIFKILNQDDIKEKYLPEDLVKKRKEKEESIKKKNEQARIKLEQQRAAIQRFSDSEEAFKIREEIRLLKEEIEKAIKEKADQGNPYSPEDVIKLRNDPRILELEIKIEARALEENLKQKQNIQTDLTFENFYDESKKFHSSINLDNFYLDLSLKLNSEILEAQKKLFFLGVPYNEFLKKSALAADVVLSDKRLILEDFNFIDPIAALNAITDTPADIVITGKYELNQNKLIFTITGYEKNLNIFVFNIKKEFELTSFELELQDKLSEISREIIKSLSNAPTAHIIVRSNLDSAIVYLNNKDVGRTEFKNRGDEYAELNITNAPIGYNYIEVIKSGYYKERGYIFIRPGDYLQTVDFTLKQIETGITLKVITEPADAKVFVDLDLIEKEPKIAKNLSEGIYKITVSLDGFHTKRLSYNVIQGIDNVLHVKLDKIDKNALTPEQLTSRYNFWKNFFFLGGVPFLGGMLFSWFMNEYYKDRAISANSYRSSIVDVNKRAYWDNVYAKSMLLRQDYTNYANIFSYSLGASLLLASIFQYLESNVSDRDDIGYKNQNNNSRLSYFGDFIFRLNFNF